MATWPEVPQSLSVPLTIGVVAGLIAGGVLLFAQRIRQWWLDVHSDWPFEVYAVGLKQSYPNAWEARIWIRNMTTRDARVIATPLDPAGKPLHAGWKIVDTWGGVVLPIFVKVGSKGWMEFWIEGNGPPPKWCKFLAAFFTLVSGKTQTYVCDFSHVVGDGSKMRIWKQAGRRSSPPPF